MSLRRYFSIFFFLLVIFFASYSAVSAAPPTIYVPYFNSAVPFEKTGIFWFGKVTPTQNYADVRFGYNNTELYLYTAVFDKRIWFDTTPAAGDLTSWDAMRLYIKTSPGSTLDANTYRITVQFGGGGVNAAGYQFVEKWNGTSFATVSFPFTSNSGWRGDSPNNSGDDRGWALTHHLPFSSFGLPTPSTGTSWHMAMELFDRDDAGGTAIPLAVWPGSVNVQDPTSWANLTFGLPTYQIPAGTNPQSVTIRHKLQNTVVADASVGGGSVCGDGLDFWTQWGEKNYAGDSLYVQNQSDVADWPCFSKFYLNFPLTLVPAGKIITSAKLTIYQFGNAGGTIDSYVQVSEADKSWTEATINWNNAPGGQNNSSYTVVPIITTFPGWPGVARTWDISWLVNKEYQQQTPLNIVLYSSDSDYSSGKYFVSSDTGDWNEVGRPTVEITYADPVTSLPSPSPSFSPHPADVDQNGKINSFDFGFIVKYFGAVWPQTNYSETADITGDGKITGADVLEILRQWTF